MPEPKVAATADVARDENPSMPGVPEHAVVPAGSVVAADGMIKTRYRCETCEADFWLVRIPLN